MPQTTSPPVSAHPTAPDAPRAALPTPGPDPSTAPAATAPRDAPPSRAIAQPTTLPATSPTPDPRGPDVQPTQTRAPDRAAADAPAADLSASRPVAPRHLDLPPPPPDAQRAVQVLHSALTAAIAESTSYGAFPFMADTRAGNAASLVIFNAAMIPSWPPALRFDQAMGGEKALQVGGAQLAQMTPEEAAEYIAKMAAGFDFLLKVKKRLNATLAEEKELLLGLFSFLGAAFDSLLRGLKMAVEQSLEEQAMLADLQVELGRKPGKRNRQRLNL